MGDLKLPGVTSRGVSGGISKKQKDALAKRRKKQKDALKNRNKKGSK